jgi:uncharacterized membrane protein
MREARKGGYVQAAMLVILALIGSLGFLTYKNFIIIELGLIGFVADLIYELYGTAKGWWSYNYSSIYVIASRVPIEVPLMYFFMGAMAALFVLWRLGF